MKIKEFYIALAMLACAMISSCYTPAHIKHASIEPDMPAFSLSPEYIAINK